MQAGNCLLQPQNLDHMTCYRLRMHSTTGRWSCFWTQYGWKTGAARPSRVSIEAMQMCSKRSPICWPGWVFDMKMRYLVGLVLLTGCAAATETVRLKSDPPAAQAQVIVDGKVEQSCATPCQLSVDLADRLVLRFEKEGFHPKSFVLNFESGRCTAFLFALGLLYPALSDFSRLLLYGPRGHRSLQHAHGLARHGGAQGKHGRYGDWPRFRSRAQRQALGCSPPRLMPAGQHGRFEFPPRNLVSGSASEGRAQIIRTKRPNFHPSKTCRPRAIGAGSGSL